MSWPTNFLRTPDANYTVNLEEHAAKISVFSNRVGDTQGSDGACDDHMILATLEGVPAMGNPPALVSYHVLGTDMMRNEFENFTEDSTDEEILMVLDTAIDRFLASLNAA